jgi:predicted nucleotidyltransferase component of viral defense system
MSEKDYKKLYQTQDKVLLALKPVLSSFYLTGGTALGRFYLNHRFSEDLDFFVNESDAFHSTIKNIERKLAKNFSILSRQSIVYDDFVRFYIEDENSTLKVEFINDVAYRCGNPNIYPYGFIDNPLNILANKLTALVGRDEPKDVFDIYKIAQHYSFNWLSVFEEAKNKAIINEIEIEKRIKSFPTVLLEKVDWHVSIEDTETIKKAIITIANDFILGSSNSLGAHKERIEDATVIIADLKGEKDRR